MAASEFMTFSQKVLLDTLNNEYLNTNYEILIFGTVEEMFNGVINYRGAT